MALSDQLLNHFRDKFGIVTVVNATFYEVDGTVPKISFDTLKMSNITSEGQQKEIRGGQGAELLLQYDFGRTANVEITDALVSVGSLEYLFGGTQSSGTKIFPRRVEGTIDTALTAGVMTEQEPADYKAGTATKVILAKPDGTYQEVTGAAAMPTVTAPAGTKYVLFYQAEYTIGSGNYVNGYLSGTFGASPALPSEPADRLANSSWTLVLRDVSANPDDVHVLTSSGTWPTVASFAGFTEATGDTYEIFYVTDVEQAGDFKEMVLKSSDFPPVVRMIGETVILDANTGRKIAMQIEIPKLKLNANFTFSFDAEGDPSVFDFSGVALSHRGELLKVRTLGDISEIN
jgi:hypothetical protein